MNKNFCNPCVLIFVSLALAVAGCKKSGDNATTGNTPIDNTGSLLDTRIDTTWKAPDGSTIQIGIETSRGPKDPFYNDSRDAYHAEIHFKVISGKFDNIHITVKFRHFPRNYSESEASTGGTYAVDEQSYSNIVVDPVTFPNLEFYRFIPDPGPIDKLEISL